MNQGVLLAILALGMTCSSEGRSETGLGPYGGVTTLRRDTVVQVKVRAVEGWGISTGYWARVTMGTESLSLGEGMFMNLSHDATAARELVWYVESPENRGTVKVVFCRPRSCSPPVTGDFEVE
jgi:hypothetical protein